MARSGARARARARAKQNLEAKQKAKPKHIPSDLLDLIFTKLPLKSLIRFKSICRNWSSTISGLPNPPPFWRCAVAGDALYSFPVDGSHRISDHHHDLAKRNDLYKDSRNSEILGSCDGVLLLYLSTDCYRDGDNDFLLLNPTTGRSKAFKGSRYSQDSSCSISGLAYDSRNHDFKVFIANQNLSPPSTPHVRFNYEYLCYDLFSTRSGVWTELRPSFPYNFYSDRLGISFNGAPHWVLHRHFRKHESFRPELPDSSLIVWFDPTDDLFKEISLPDWLADYQGKIELGILRERLCVVACNELNKEFETWSMMEHGIEESWTKLFVFNSHNLPMSLTVLMPLCCSRNGEFMLMEADRHKVVVYDVRDEIWRMVGIVYNQKRFKVAAYVESLLDPNENDEACSETREYGKVTMRGWDEEDEYDYVLKY